MATIKSVLQTRPFQPLFAGMEALLIEAEPIFNMIEDKRRKHDMNLDQGEWAKEKHLATASFLLGMSGLESFVMCLYEEYKSRSEDSLPDEIFRTKKRLDHLRGQGFEWWPLNEKLYFIIPICANSIVDPRKVLKRDRSDWQRLDEYIKIRNAIVHARPEEVAWVITMGEQGVHTVDDSDSRNHWPKTKSPKDVRNFNTRCARDARSSILWIKSVILDTLAERVPPRFMLDEQVKLIDRW